MATERSAARPDVAVPPRVNQAASLGNSEVFQNIIIAAGKNISIDSTMDYSSAGTVAITVECVVCNSAGTSLGTAGLVIQASWMVPNAMSYVATENRAATAFPYWDVGAAIFNVYGTQFRLILQNKGTQTIAIQQVTMFRRSQLAAGSY